jgi:FixJ family two-component response regulator
MNADRVVHLVDDEEAIRKSAGFVLSRAGYKVHPYGSGVEFRATQNTLQLAAFCWTCGCRTWMGSRFSG